jgi:hypothetical protein
MKSALKRFSKKLFVERKAQVGAPSNKRLKLAARVDCGMSLSSARRSLSAFR